MLEETAVKTMLEAGATFADVATAQAVTLAEVQGFCVAHDLAEPTLQQLSHIRKLAGAQHPQGAAHWERLLRDDVDGHIVNGINTQKSDGNVNALEIIRHYHGECRCYYSDESTDLVMSADGNPQNLLVSNLVPITQSVLDARFRDTMTFLLDMQYEYEHFTVSLMVEHRFDKLLGTGFNRTLVDEAMDQWIRPYGERYWPIDILEYFEVPASPDLLALWVWQQLEKRALLKGMARVKVERESWYAGYATKQQILAHTKQMLARQFGQRSVLTSQPAVMPPPGHGPAPARLIKL